MVQTLLNAGPGGVLESGIAPSIPPESAPFWADGENVSFRNLGVEKAQGWTGGFTLGRPVISLSQARWGGIPRIYAQTNDFNVWGWNGGGLPYLIGNAAGRAEIETYGTHLFIAHNGLKRWSNSGAATTVAGSPAGTYLLAKNSNHLLAASYDTLHWADVKDAGVWTGERSNTAGNIPFRNLESPIACVRELSGRLAVYTKETLYPVQYVGAPFWFGQRGVPVNGVGAISARSVVEAGFQNYGLTLHGIFVTDGMQFKYLDDPVIRDWLIDNVDWGRKDEVFGWHNERNQEVSWHFPAVSGEWKGITFSYARNAFSRHSLPIYSAADRDVFDAPLLGTGTGVALSGGYVSAPAWVRTKPLDAGEALQLKLWNYLRTISAGDNPRVKIGVSDRVGDDPIWVYDGPLAAEHYIGVESAFLTLEFYANSASDLKVSQILLAGEVGGTLL